MKLFELSADFERHARRAIGAHATIVLQHFGKAAAFDILHRDVEIAVQIAEIVDLDHARVERAQALLDGCAAALGFEQKL